jgi:hypothetical protein
MLISIHRSPSTAGLRWLDNFGHSWKNELLQRATELFGGAAADREK